MLAGIIFFRQICAETSRASAPRFFREKLLEGMRDTRNWTKT
jgi:hypothetical protein